MTTPHEPSVLFRQPQILRRAQEGIGLQLDGPAERI
jgi:hypothetical protein